jgi:hypothetical protein
MYVIAAAYLISFRIIISSAWALMTGVYQGTEGPSADKSMHTRLLQILISIP